MPRLRSNDPANLPSAPNLVKDSARDKELIAEFQRRFWYLVQHYSLARQILGDDLAFNQDLERLKRAVVRKRARKGLGKMLRPEIAMVVSHHARKLAKMDGVEVSEKHTQRAAVITSGLLKSRAGRPDDHILEHHVTGAVALIQEASGLPVIARRYSKSVYSPHFAEGLSRIIPQYFEDVSRGITEARLVRIVERIRAKYAGKQLRFLPLFPGYGATVGEDGIELRPGLRLEAFEPNFPIFCH